MIVNNVSELIAALDSAQPGQVIKCADGDYGNLADVLNGRSFGPDGADLASADLTDFRGRRENDPAQQVILRAQNLFGARGSGYLDDAVGFRFEDWEFSVFWFTNCRRCDLFGNLIRNFNNDATRVDVYQRSPTPYGLTQRIGIRYNVYSESIITGASAHPDIIQFVTGATSGSGTRIPPHHIEIIGNICVDTQEPGVVGAQGIFMSDAHNEPGHDSIIVEDNMISAPLTNNLTGVIMRNSSIRHNTVRSNRFAAAHANDIYRTKTTVIENNVAPTLDLPADGTEGNTVQNNHVLDSAWLPSGIALTDVAAWTLTGAPANAGARAEERNFHVNRTIPDGGGAPPPNPDPDPGPDPDPEPSTMIRTILEFDRYTTDPIIYPADARFALAQGSASVGLTAVSFDGTPEEATGFFSMDANGNGEGHIGLLHDGSDLWVRLQTSTFSHEIKVPASLVAGQHYNVVVTWGDLGMRLYLDGVAIGTNAYTGGTVGIIEPLVIGANAWASSTGQTDILVGQFNGELLLRLHDWQMTDSEVAELQAPTLDPALVYHNGKVFSEI